MVERFKLTEEIVDERIIRHKCKYTRGSDIIKTSDGKFIIAICNDNPEHKWQTDVYKIGKRGCHHCMKVTIEEIDKRMLERKCEYRREEGTAIKYKKSGGEVRAFVCTVCNKNVNHKWDLRVYHIGDTGCPVCKVSSKGETVIANYCKERNIKYIREHTYKDCKDKGLLRFDFNLPEYNLIIEFHGEQHYYSCGAFGSKIQGAAWNKFLDTNKKDNIKKNYCINNNINFLEIGYFEFDDIANILDKKIEELKLQQMSNIAFG